jgi:secondary thiamine-phosphate synthase enzyme
MLTTLLIETQTGDAMINVTERVQQAVTDSHIQEGVCTLVVPHTTAAITLNCTQDPATLQDIIGEVKRLIPTRIDFHHQYDTPTDAAAHVKATLIGQSQSLIIHKGRLLLGHAQSVLFFEFDGPRQRQLYIKIVPG